MDEQTEQQIGRSEQAAAMFITAHNKHAGESTKGLGRGESREKGVMIDK